jgi:hypothetical protein
MALIFHQNMRDFGGNSNARNILFSNRFDQINTALGNLFIAAGLTELMNTGAGLHHNLPIIVQALDPGLTNFVVIEVGTTAFGRREFIAIATKPANFPITDAGHVLYDSMNNTWAIFNTPVGNIVANRINLPATVNLAADNRGVAYVAGAYNGNNYLLGFMHNMNKLRPPTLGFDALGRMANLMRNNVPGYGGARVIIGGDFNLAPRDPANRGVRLYGRCCRNVFGLPVFTTVANPLDFFVVSHAGTTDANVNTCAQTLIVPGGSDHCGITLFV